MCVIEFSDEGISPGLAGVDADVHVVLPMPLSPFCVSHLQGVADGC